ncbi:LCP family protein [Spiractinospora alimapuensis]|uniref:LCP family protein n=1 Tax=Spiractinospora alimapuensis TaxID=2820884 RepID=UPI001F2971C9|nr:LCP family protein [Spiractinospora alimapuensis]QVQ54396.1 LCP family protein [Spiractinospora alimapuensis]
MSRRSAPARRSRRTRQRLSALSWISVVLTGVLVAGSLSAYAAFYDIYGQLDQEAIDTDAFGDRPSQVEGAVNVMIIGSDVRTGENADYGDAEGERPDTLIIAHISPSHDGATLVNIPRDSIVDLPQCEATDDRPGLPPSRDMIGVALTLGGPACLWNAVEQLTGIHIDHYVHMDFSGFKDMVDALGGVEMCIPEPIDDDKAHLQLDAGLQTLNGEESLGFVRARYALGDGSDLSRIERQQEFMGAMAQKATSSEIITSPTSIHSFLGAVAQSITTDDQLNVDTMADIAISMREVDMDNIEFVTVPSGPAPEDENRIAWHEPDATELFQAIAQDTEITDVTEDEEEPEPAEEDAEPAPDVAPEEVQVQVLNATATQGLAAEVADELTMAGFVVTGTGNPEGEVPTESTVLYGPGQEGHAEAVAAEVGGISVEESPYLDSSVQLVLAGDWTGMSGGGTADESGGGSAPDAGTTTAADVDDSACS